MPPAPAPLKPETCGWLQHLHEKATTPDDWSASGRPLPWWDDRSAPPVMDFPRFDLQESSYVVPILADLTPAWREVYVEILDGLLSRYTTHWGAIDWVTQIGHDPERENYPEEIVKIWIPEHLAGQYDRPGWVANGVEPWGLEPDPVGATGNLFFKGWLDLLLGFRASVSGEGRWGSAFDVTGLHGVSYSWTHDGVNSLLARQWRERPEGPHCENTKVWPECLSAAGLGLMLHDRLTGGNEHAVYDQWIEILKQRYLGMKGSDGIEWLAIYWDPLVDYVHKSVPADGIALAFYMLPQEPELAEVLYRAAASYCGWDDPSQPVANPDPGEPRYILLGAILAREFGDSVTFARLSTYMTDHFGPRRYLDGELQFGWDFGLGEPYPRGQFNAISAIWEIDKPGAWREVFTNPNLTKFDEPTVSGIDFPKLGLRTAWNERETGILHLATYAGRPSARGTQTSFRVSQLADAASCQVRCDGAPYDRWRRVDQHTIEIDTTVGEHEIQIFAASSGRGGEGPTSRGRTAAESPKAVAGSGHSDRPSATAGSPQERIAALGVVPRPRCACC